MKKRQIIIYATTLFLLLGALWMVKQFHSQATPANVVQASANAGTTAAAKQQPSAAEISKTATSTSLEESESRSPQQPLTPESALETFLREVESSHDLTPEDLEIAAQIGNAMQEAFEGTKMPTDVF